MKSMFTYFLLVIPISILLPSCFCIRSSDTISTGQPLFSNQTIISKNGRFELGFFAPGDSINFYVGIWYRNIPARTIVWVGNRNNPIRPSYVNVSLLEMSNGTLNLYVNSVMITIIGPVNSDANEAVILDTGNLVLIDANSSVTWQSFDDPTDTWLPGGRLGFRWLSDAESELVSWRNPNDPSSGAYSFGMQANGGSELFITANGASRLWRSGIWQDGTFASLSDNSAFYNFTYAANDDAEYLTYNVLNESVISRIQIDYVGRMMHYVWSESSQAWLVIRAQPSDACKRYATCGPNSMCDINNSPFCSCLGGFEPRDRAGWNSFNFSGGCGRTRPLGCSDERTGYVEVNNIRLPADPESLAIQRNGVCQIVCSLNCSCGGYAIDSVGGCLLFMGDLVDLERLSNGSRGGNLYIRTESDAIAVARPGNGRRHVLPLAIALPLAVGILISSFCLCYYLRPKLKTKEIAEAHQNMLLLDLNSVGNINGEKKNNQYELPIFNFSSIAVSTNNFSITNKLGEGGFGPVYKGELLNGQFVAVKRLSKRSGQGLEEFRNETELIAKLQHRNLVGILGCCIENDEKILVYEYMPHKSLDFFLFDPTSKQLLDWRRRVHIIEGIAQGLLYLHHYSRLRIVHRDLKASNILLDAEMNPKISDFGMARIFGGNDSQANTKRIVGTYGYMSPEYAMEGLFSVKSDVFAFGVLLLEIISGKKNTGFYGSDYLSLLGYAWHMWNHDRVLELIDPILEIHSSSSSTPIRYIQIGLLCIQESPDDRPMMSDVVAMLNNEQTLIASPQQPGFTVKRTLTTASPGQGKVEICSVNGLTVSQMEAR